MLEIRLDQLVVLTPPRAAFIDATCDHLRGVWPRECATLGRSGLRAFVSTSCGRARSHGLEGEFEVRRFIELAITFGAEFDAQPWARAALEGPLGPSRIARLWTAALAELERG